MIAIVLLGLLGALTHSLLGQSWTSTSGHAVGSDDAYISYRYASNLFYGTGLVFNPGEYVEGYSNFLYVILLLPAFFVSADFVYIYSVAINCVFLVSTILIYFWFARVRQGKNTALAGALLLAMSPWLWANVATGLETSLILFLTTTLWICGELYLERRERWLLVAVLVLCGLSILSRVDGFILPVAFALYCAARGEWKLVSKILLLVVTLAVIYTGWRYFYYQDVIANTYYNKVSGSPLVRVKAGLSFVAEYIVRTGLWVGFLAVLATVAMAIYQRRLRTGIGFAEFFVVLWLSYLIWIGGDIYYERFLVAILPMGIYLSLGWVGRKSSTGSLLVFTLFFMVCQSVFAFKDGRFDYRISKYDCWVLVGKFLGESYPGATLAVDAAGKIPYFSGLFTIDMLGLNDRHIGKMKVESTEFHPGHSKFDPDYVIGRKPDVIAVWIAPDLNLGWGITRSLYKGSYHLKYLVNPSREDLGAGNIVDVTGMDDAAIKELIARNMNYAILVRN